MAARCIGRRRIAVAVFPLIALTTLAACSGASTAGGAPSKAAGNQAAAGAAAPAAASAGAGNVAALNELIAAEHPASAAQVAANPVAAKIKARGVLIVGGVQVAPLFSLLNVATGETSGFDADLDQLLAKYIIGKNSTRLVTVSAATREALLENHSVDAVFATYTITPAREKVVDFAGPYYIDGLGIAIKKDATGIASAADLNGKTVVTESGSTIPDAIKSAAPTAKVLLFDTDAECVEALEQGRADAYVLDQGILAGDAVRDSGITVLPRTFDAQPYGIGVPRDEPSFKAFINTWLQQIEADGTWAKLWKDTIGTVVAGSPPVPPKIG